MADQSKQTGEDEERDGERQPKLSGGWGPAASWISTTAGREPIIAISDAPVQNRARQKSVKSRLYERARDIPPEVAKKISRSGVIPYYVPPPERTLQLSEMARRESPLWFALGIDANHGELTDAGGRCRPDESLELAAARELAEESNHIFEVSAEELSECPVVVGRDACIFFWNIGSPVYEDENWIYYPFGAGLFPDRLASTFALARCALVRRIVADEARSSSLPEEMRPRRSLAMRSAPMLENSLMYWVSANDLKRLCGCRRKRATPPAALDDTESTTGDTPSARLVVRMPPTASHIVAPVVSSGIRLPEWQIVTNMHLQKLSGEEPDGSRSECHPKMYSLLRSALNPVIKALCERLLA